MTNTAVVTPIQTGLFSADSHVMEPVTAWEGILPATFWPPEGTSAGRWGDKGGGFDPSRRSAEMAEDGVIAEVLYPSRGSERLRYRRTGDSRGPCASAYNVWLADYCSVAPDRLLGIGMIPSYDAERGVEEIASLIRQGFGVSCSGRFPIPTCPSRVRTMSQFGTR